jgi:ATP-binding cassette subfamily C protein
MKISIASMKRFACDLLRDSPRRAAQAAALIVLSALIDIAGLLLLIPLLNVVFGPASARIGFEWPVHFPPVGGISPSSRLTAILGLYVVLAIARAIVLGLRDVAITRLQLAFTDGLRTSLAKHLAAASWEHAVRLQHARIAGAMGSDLQKVSVGLYFLVQFTVAGVTLAVQAGLALVLAPAPTAIALGVLAISVLLLGPALRRSHDVGSRVARTTLAFASDTAQFLDGLKLAISQSLEGAFIEEFHATQRKITESQIGHVVHTAKGQLAFAAITAAAVAGIVLAGFDLFHVSPAVLIMLLVLLSRLSGPAAQLQTSAQQLAYAVPAYTMVKDLDAELAAHKAAAASSGSRRQFPVEGPIAFETVGFRRGTSAVLRRVTLTLHPGEIAGISGPSGAGKTTFADLLVGLLRPQTGRILVSGIELTPEMLPAWRRCLSYVTQDAFLFHDTIRRNLAWACPDADEGIMWQMLDVVGIAGLVRRLPQQLDSMVGERGALFSGGERQRLALARGLLRQPRLLILDEATSAIDIPGERAILDRLAALAQRPIIVMIAHRPQSLAHCGRVFAIEDGALIPALPSISRSEAS